MTNVYFPFRLKKAIQASAYLIECENHQRMMTRLRLLKLLYIADRESLKETGYPITGDAVAAMDHGPVLSRIYNLIKGKAHSEEWSSFLHSDGYEVLLVADPGLGQLSEYETDKLCEISTRYKDMDEWDIVNDIVHFFPEWLKNEPPVHSSRPISLEDIIAGINRSEDKDEILRGAAEETRLDLVLGLSIV